MQSTVSAYAPLLPPRARVAVVGAGISGVCAAAHLLRSGGAIDVVVFERAAAAGGVWRYDPRSAPSPSYPSETPSADDYHGSIDSSNGTSASASLFSPPSPCYAGLRNNVPITLMVSSLGGWPNGTPETTTHDVVARYVADLAAECGVDAVTLYNTRVEEVRKDETARKWTVRTLTLAVDGDGGEKGEHKGGSRLEERTWTFDAVVVASGHYNLPRVPAIPGLAAWKAAFDGEGDGDSGSGRPQHVVHSKQYRSAEPYRGSRVLVIGAGVSALDICRELLQDGGSGGATAVYQSTRGSELDLPAALMAPGVERVGEIARFELLPEAAAGSSAGQDGAPAHLPGRIVLKDGRAFTREIDHVILATGYMSSYPFLRQLHDDGVAAEEAGPASLVASGGDVVHNLHRDIFYLPDPTLAFVGVPFHTATFSLFDFQAQMVARVFSGRADLPGPDDMRAEYDERVRAELARGRERGGWRFGRAFHSLRDPGRELEYVRDLVDWANRDAARLGAPPMQGHAEPWVREYWALKQKMRAAGRWSGPQ